VTKRRTWAVALGSFAGLCVFNCTENVEVGRDLGSGGSAALSGSAPSNAGAGSDGLGGSMPHSCIPSACQGKIYLCGDCRDNDDDGLIDSDDPECTGPCDNTEDSYYGGIPGQNNAPCRQDCYFDQNTGAGDDECYWSHECDPKSVAPDFPPSGDSHCTYQADAEVPGSSATCAELNDAQSSTCLDTCLPITPNGCDCFGCCELPSESGKWVWIGSVTQNVGTCDAAHVDDPSACRPCTPVRSCLNVCDPCEVCVGRTSPSPDCESNGPPRCPVAVMACGQPDEPNCPVGYYCITGCCAAAPR